LGWPYTDPLTGKPSLGMMDCIRRRHESGAQQPCGALPTGAVLQPPCRSAAFQPARLTSAARRCAFLPSSFAAPQRQRRRQIRVAASLRGAAIRNHIDGDNQ